MNKQACFYSSLCAIFMSLLFSGFRRSCFAMQDTQVEQPSSHASAVLPEDQHRKPAPDRQLTAYELLRRFSENKDKLKSFIAVTEVSVSRETTFADGFHRKYAVRQRLVKTGYEIARKEARINYTIGEPMPRQGTPVVLGGTWHSHLWNGKRYYAYWRTPAVNSSLLRVSSDDRFIRRESAIAYEGICPFLGVILHDVERLDNVLKQSETLSVRESLERVGSSNCYVIDAKTQHDGTYQVWLDPEHGCSIARAIVHKGPEDLRHGRPPRSSYIDDAAYNVVRYENVDGVWIPMEIDLRSEDTDKSGTCTKWHAIHKVREFVLDPDHAELGTFVPNVEDGTEVLIEEDPRIEFVWRDGKIVTDVDLVDASVVIESAIVRAQKEGKKVFLRAGTDSYEWCTMLDDFLKRSDIISVLERDYVLVKFDLSNARGAHSIMNKYRDPNEAGWIPWCAVLDEQGQAVVTSTEIGGDDIGFANPDSDEDIEVFADMVKQTRARITDDEIQYLKRALRLTKIGREIEREELPSGDGGGRK